MDVLSEQLHGSARKKVLRRRVHQVGVRIVVRERRVDVGERQDDGKQREDDDVDLLAEEHTENGPPVGVPRGRDLFGFQIAVADRGEKLFVGQDGLRIGFLVFHIRHLAILQKHGEVAVTVGRFLREMIKVYQFLFLRLAVAVYRRKITLVLHKDIGDDVGGSIVAAQHPEARDADCQREYQRCGQKDGDDKFFAELFHGSSTPSA